MIRVGRKTAINATSSLARTGSVEELPLSCIRRDGRTQNRLKIDPATVDEYAALLADGTVFPPVTVWFDGTDYWLTDGLHRTAAAEQSGKARIACEVRYGTLSEAQWDSYAANAGHGVRRSCAETQKVIRLALQHPNAARLSNVQIARHLHVPETTLRRWRKQLSSPSGEDIIRVVTRGETTYPMRTDGIGRSHETGRRVKPTQKLLTDLAEMEERASQDVLRVLNIVGKWVAGSMSCADCIEAMEDVIRKWKDPTWPEAEGNCFSRDSNSEADPSVE